MSGDGNTGGSKSQLLLEHHVAKDWVTSRNGEIPATMTVKETRQRYWWQCHQGHLLQLAPKTRVQSGCRTCKILEKRPSLLQVAPLLAPLWHQELNQWRTPANTPATSHEGAYIHCAQCREVFEISVRMIARTQGICSRCRGTEFTRVSDDPNLLKLYDDANAKSPEEVFLSSREKYLWRCDAQGHVVECRPRVMKRGCPRCQELHLIPLANSLASRHPEVLKHWDWSENDGIPEGYAPKSNAVVAWRCERDACHRWRCAVNLQVRRGTCPLCGNHTLIPGVNDLSIRHPELLDALTARGREALPHMRYSDVASFQCPQGHVYERTIYEFLRRGGGCPSCALPGTSHLEREVAAYLRKIAPRGVEILERDRKLLDGMELDIYVPTLSWALEINGDFWHSEEHLLKTLGETPEERHGRKLQRARGRGVALHFLWEHHWRTCHQDAKTWLREVVNGGTVAPELKMLRGPLDFR